MSGESGGQCLDEGYYKFSVWHGEIRIAYFKHFVYANEFVKLAKKYSALDLTLREDDGEE